jgi:polyisoprenoid-binding protein YceI
MMKLACALTLAAACPALAQDIALQTDPAQTKVEFTLSAMLHTVHGGFALKSGDIRFNPATGQASGELVVDATSGSSGNSGRDRRMHSSVLESGRYSEIAFRPDRVEGAVAPQGASQVRIHGVFRIHGAEHELTLPVEVEAADGRYSATVTFAVPYVKWGMKNPSTLFLRVSDTVSITVHTVARAAR